MEEIKLVKTCCYFQIKRGFRIVVVSVSQHGYSHFLLRLIPMRIRKRGTEQSLEKEGKIFISYPLIYFLFLALSLALIKHRRKKKPGLKIFECILLPI